MSNGGHMKLLLLVILGVLIPTSLDAPTAPVHVPAQKKTAAIRQDKIQRAEEAIQAYAGAREIQVALLEDNSGRPEERAIVARAAYLVGLQAKVLARELTAPELQRVPGAYEMLAAKLHDDTATDSAVRKLTAEEFQEKYQQILETILHRMFPTSPPAADPQSAAGFFYMMRWLKLWLPRSRDTTKAVMAKYSKTMRPVRVFSK